jgi:hypothetical protein
MRPLVARSQASLGRLAGDPEAREHLEAARALCAALDLRLAPGPGA